ncbi:MAG: tRNA (N6-isopentenyl adenosine(37)-C2)-methylthiotransferase MiaB [Clostridiales bacterium]|nr:tRNA (N6-isopentenyl adenosine(37)-C2)-methylthiotransferase MiaB [Clostridiales bacterium]
MVNNINFDEINISRDAPVAEPERQYYFIARARAYLGHLEAEVGRKLTFCVCTFGCQMNARDSEKLCGILKAIGYEQTVSEDADFTLYNTCTVRENANLRVYGRLGYLNGYKRKNPHMIVALCGCMMQESQVVEKIKKSYSFVDLIFGTHNIFKLPELLVEVYENREYNITDAQPAGGGQEQPGYEEAKKGYAFRVNQGEAEDVPARKIKENKTVHVRSGMVVDIWQDTDQVVEQLPNERKYLFKSGVNIMFGCNNFCSYCIVPYVRGRERSRRPEEIIDEIKALVADGVIEVMLLGQNVNSYGKNLDEPVSFAELLRRIEEIDGLERIRFMTSHPKDLSDELIEVMGKSKKICHHLHLPLQSGSSRLLKIMNRKYTREHYLELVEKIRAAVPDIAITTDIIVGFPGETEEDFEETLDVVRKVRYDSAFTFLYSKRSGTPAAAMEDQIPEAVAKERFDRLLKEVQSIAAEKSAELTGQIQDVLVESINKQDASLVTGRLGNNSVVHLPGDDSLIGKIVPVRLDKCRGFYYIGSMMM